MSHLSQKYIHHHKNMHETFIHPTPKGIVVAAVEGLAPIFDHGPYPIGWNATFTLAGQASPPGVDVRLLVDRSIVEIFVAGGQVPHGVAPPHSTLPHVDTLCLGFAPLYGSIGSMHSYKP